jgi:hypothetical protein
MQFNKYIISNSSFLPSIISFLYDGVRLSQCRFLDTNPEWAVRGTNQEQGLLNEIWIIEIGLTLNTVTKGQAAQLV